MTIGTDARHLYYNPDYIDGLSLEQTQFALAHEALHCALSHFARREHRNENRWDIACDLAINPILIKEGMTAVPGALYNIGYEGMMAEEIYPLVKENSEEQTHDQHLYGKENKSAQQQPQNGKDTQPDEPDSDSQESAGGDSGGEDEEQAAGEPDSLSDAEKEQLSVQWRQRMAGAAQQAMQAGKLAGSLRKLVDHLLQPQLPWRMLLARYMTASSRDDYSYMRPSRREGDAIFPSLRSAQTDIVVVLDTSGSIKPAEMQEFVTEIDAIKGRCEPVLPYTPVMRRWRKKGHGYLNRGKSSSCREIFMVAAAPALRRCSNIWMRRGMLRTCWFTLLTRRASSQNLKRVSPLSGW